MNDYKNSELTGAEMILAERRREIAEEGFTPEHDDQWNHGELVNAAMSYEVAAEIDRLKRSKETGER